MRTTLKFPTQLAIATVMGLALCTSFGVGRANAQNKNRTGAATRHTDMTVEHDNDNDYDEVGMPTTPSYPEVAPGTLDLNHWSDYRHMHMRAGSAHVAHMEMMHDRAMKHHRDADTKEELEDARVPMAMNYPRAAPGTVDLNHWSDYRMLHLRPGSAADETMEKMHNKAMRSSVAYTREEEEEDLLPTPPSYPEVAPGTLDLNHWTDMRAMHLKPGSTTEAREEKRKMKHEKMQQK